MSEKENVEKSKTGDKKKSKKKRKASSPNNNNINIPLLSGQVSSFERTKPRTKKCKPDGDKVNKSSTLSSCGYSFDSSFPINMSFQPQSGSLNMTVSLSPRPRPSTCKAHPQDPRRSEIRVSRIRQPLRQSLSLPLGQ